MKKILLLGVLFSLFNVAFADVTITVINHSGRRQLPEIRWYTHSQKIFRLENQESKTVVFKAGWFYGAAGDYSLMSGDRTETFHTANIIESNCMIEDGQSAIVTINPPRLRGLNYPVEWQCPT